MKKGDTLVEVSLAIGIFSMVAIAAVSVINGSTNGAQASLESTITREEIDGQAEALRFIQSAYVAGGEVENVSSSKYASLWQNIANHAIDLSRLSDSERDAVLKYNPVSCNEIYNSSDTAGWNTLKKQNAFLINTRAMGSSNWNQIVVGYNPSTFRTASTYPRIIYNSLTTDALYESASNNFSITSAEGIYVIAVRDKDGTVIVSDSGGGTTTKSAYIDFYIRSCWFTPSADRASTISTAIRLYDPDAINVNKFQRKGILIRYGGNGATTGSMSQQYVYAGDSSTILSNQFTRPGWRFKYWTTNANGSGTRYYPGDIYRAPANLSASSSETLYAQWERLQVNIVFNANGGSGNMATQSIVAGTSQKLNSNNFSRPGYTFNSWNTKANGSGTRYNNQATYSVPGDILNEQTVTLYAQWTPTPYTLSYSANGGSNAPAAQTCYFSTIQACYVTSAAPTRSGYKFTGWSESSTATSASYSAGSRVNITGNKTLYAVWQTRDETITIRAQWSSGSDYDSYLRLQKPDGTFVDANYATRNIPVTFNGVTYSLVTGAGDGRGSVNAIYREDYTIHTLGGKNYYYSIRLYPAGNVGNDITITVSGPYLGTQVFYSSRRNCNGNYWNVFAYKDGVIVPRNTCSAVMEYDY